VQSVVPCIFNHGFGLSNRSNRFKAKFEGLSRRLDSRMGTDSFFLLELLFGVSRCLRKFRYLERQTSRTSQTSCRDIRDAVPTDPEAFKPRGNFSYLGNLAIFLFSPPGGF
jgi:hypothetical protein